MAGHDLSSDFYQSLERLSFLVVGVYEAYGVFKVLEGRADDINRLGIGRPFRYLQFLAIDRMVLNFGKATSDLTGDLSFRSLRAEMDEFDVVDRKPIDDYLNRFQINSSSNIRKRYCSFRDDFFKFDDVEYVRLKAARNQFIAHSDKVAKWADIGVRFSDVEKFIDVAKARIDSCFHVFFNLSAPKESLFEKCKGEPDQNIRAFERLVETSLVAAQNR